MRDGTPSIKQSEKSGFLVKNNNNMIWICIVHLSYIIYTSLCDLKSLMRSTITCSVLTQVSGPVQHPEKGLKG